MSFRPWQPIFLAALCQTGSVAHAAQAAGVTRQGAYLARSTQNRWGQDRLETLAFAQVWREALFHAAETVEVELRQRALHGVEREKHFYYKGQCVGVQKYRVYNDSLLVLLAKLVLPTYRDRETFEYPVALRPPTLLENQFVRLDENDLDELEDLTNLASDLWGQVLNILDGSPATDNENDDDEATEDEAEGETELENDELEVSSLVELDESASPSEVNISASDSCFLTSDSSPVSSPSLPETPLLQMRTLHLANDFCEGGSGVGAIPDSQVSSQPLQDLEPSNASDINARPTPDTLLPTASPDPSLPPPGALIYDFDNASRRARGLNT